MNHHRGWRKMSEYVHGYSAREAERLKDQAQTLVELLHRDSSFPPGSLVLEAGCGVGAQTVTLAAQSLETKFISMDISLESVQEARRQVQSIGSKNAVFLNGDIFNLPFHEASFDHLFLCFVLEHLKEPVKALLSLKKLLKPGGTITVIEGDHGSVYFYPDSPYAQKAIDCQVQLQAQAGGDSKIGRRLYPLLAEAGFDRISVSPRMVYVDSSRPQWVDGFTKKTFTAMVEGVRKDALLAGLITEADFDRGIRDLYRTAETDGTFCYCFFKAFGTRF